MTDAISDLLTRIRNAAMRNHTVCSVPASNLKLRIVKLLKMEGYLRNYKLIRDNKQGIIKIALKYTEEGESVITELNRISKPSVRTYVKNKELTKLKKGFGITVLSTPKGILTDRQAQKEKVGGEVLFNVW